MTWKEFAEFVTSELKRLDIDEKTKIGFIDINSSDKLKDIEVRLIETGIFISG